MSRISLVGNATQGVTTGGNFSKCLSRFDGSKDSVVNAFIDAVCIYKDCAQVSDANALKELPRLFDGFAAKWYQGVKTTWNVALLEALFKTTFGPRKPPYRVYRELFATEQDLNTPTYIFICKLRSVLAQLPSGTLTEGVQWFGLLNRRIREKVPREKMKTFSELLTNSRLIEETFDRSDKIVTKDTKDTQRRQYCKNIGHTKDECRKLSNRNSQDNGKPKTSTRDSNTARFSSSNSTSDSTSRSNIIFALSCYGCGMIGFIRTNCPSCNNFETSSMEFFSIDTLIAPLYRPYIHVDILGHHGQGLIDTAAKQSVP
ncbi:LOW QUALITY PROTEIN: activity-regulated cytoskeleton associated protein 1-like [Leptinotarsa decemlineata]|uniref:LOW QUALITY PROTEIN: activity-regulated cytoskeleton associated protein 1-like n=1 Tax=Leptinotarsa decemlineata TaxID=7539 RepID=UPI003D30B180